MTETLTIYPDADLAGDWEGINPTPVDAANYIEPLVIGTDVAGYLAEDSDADSDIAEALTLPEIGVSGGGTISLVGISTYDGNATTATTHQIPYPSVSILPGDFLEVITSVQESSTSTFTPSASGWTQRYLTNVGVSFIPQIWKAYKTAAGGESGTLAVTFSTACRVVARIRVWRGVDTSNPYAVASQVQTGSDAPNPDPNGLTTLVNNAVVTIECAGNEPGGSSFTVSAGYTSSGGINGSDRDLVSAHKLVPTAGSEDPGAFAWAGVENAQAMTDALRPGTAVDLAAFVITAVTDNTETAELSPGDAPVLSGASFTLETSVQTPRSVSYRPQIHVWSARITNYVPGDQVDITVAEHDSLHSWAAALLIVSGLDATEVDAVGTESDGFGALAGFGATTPATAGAKILAFLAKGKGASAWYSSGQGPIPTNVPGYALAAQANGDAVQLSAWLSPPTGTTQARTPGAVGWAGNEHWATGVLALKPASPAASASDLYSAVNGEDTATYVEIAGAAGAMDEVLELDLGSLPSSAILVSARVEIVHESSTSNPLQVEIVGINADDSRVVGGGQESYLPTSLTEPSTITTGSWSTLSDGSPISDFDRLGVRLVSTSRAPGLTSHKVYTVRAVVEYDLGGPVVSSVVGPATAGDPITWVYSSDSGLAQTHYQVMVIEGSSQDPAAATTAVNPLDAATGEIIYDSGMVPGSLARSLTVADGPLGRGNCTVGVRAWARSSAGHLVASDWSTANFDISGSAPTNPTQDQADPTFEPTTGAWALTVETPAGVSRAWLLRSDDSGSSYQVTAGSPYVVSASQASVTLRDYHAPFDGAGVRYRVAFDAGSMSETSEAQIVGPSGAVNHQATLTAWYFVNTTNPSLNLVVDDDEVAIEPGTLRQTSLRRSVTITQPNGNNLSVFSSDSGSRFSMTIRTLSKMKRDALVALLAAGPFRMIDILGNSWTVVHEGDRAIDMMRVQPGPGETTAMRDAYLHDLDLIEVAST